MSHRVSLSSIVAGIDDVIHQLDQVSGQHMQDAAELKQYFETLRTEVIAKCEDGERSFLVEFGGGQA